ncbi:hypothetical protein [Novipirellula artificiosorum]|uniref:Uncharacterized protein n=1 Tax=Novipirellula artificiosorum TaxID=2528016 RepID=A0A5C6D5E3_9BACT|nr:hypothetical protein [Novipirellula artificiosorum]TWU32182.1 hypothetical protein Poly41_56670 [Novipirellula artificiosorum]
MTVRDEKYLTSMAAGYPTQAPQVSDLTDRQQLDLESANVLASLKYAGEELGL